MLDSLTLDQMRVLIAVAEAGSFSAAARQLGRVQSAVSQAMQVLDVDRRPILTHQKHVPVPSLPALRFATCLQPWHCVVTT